MSKKLIAIGTLVSPKFIIVSFFPIVYKNRDDALAVHCKNSENVQYAATPKGTKKFFPKITY
jgi:hypothetical protein